MRQSPVNQATGVKPALSPQPQTPALLSSSSTSHCTSLALKPQASELGVEPTVLAFGLPNDASHPHTHPHTPRSRSGATRT